MPDNDVFVEMECCQLCHDGEDVCGDDYRFERLENENRHLAVLSDGLGSGIKANLLACMTTTMALEFIRSNMDVLLSAEQPGSFRGKRVYPVGPDGAIRLADATQLLTFYLAGAEPLAGGLEKFRQDASPEKLLVCVCPGEVSREWAEETGRRLGLRLIRFAGESALYGL